jgi:hypothetical protein
MAELTMALRGGTMSNRWRVFALGLATLAWVTAASAHDKAKDQKAEYLEFLRLLPGDYDNLSETENDASGDHVAVILSIKPFDAQLLGRLVMFVTETAANDPHRQLAQHIWTVEHDKDNQIVQRVYQFKEPQRWVGASQDLLLLQSLLPDDLQIMSGCELYWTKTASGFSAMTRPNACRPAGSAEGHLVDIGAQLSADDLVLTEQQAGPGGRLPPGLSAANTYHFQRRGG